MNSLKSTIKTIQHLIASTLDISADRIEIEPLAGDASDRKFYRAHLPDGTRRVVMQMETPLPAPEDPDSVPFINILTHLTLCKAAVPRLYDYDPLLGMVILEDLGSLTLEDYVSDYGLGASLSFYKKAIEELLIVQIVGTRKKCEHCIAFHHSFDVTKLMWELDFFLEHTVRGHLKRKIAPTDLLDLRSRLQDLSRIIASEPRYFTHRDYHSRNLVIRDQRIGIVDFQDARMGPLQYDLCSLLRDSYVVLPDDMVEELISFYVAGRNKLEGTKTDLSHFRRIFDLTSLQRNLKAAGTFGFMAGVKGNERYLHYLPDTFDYIRKNLQKYPELQPLRTVLGRSLPEIL